MAGHGRGAWQRLSHVSWLMHGNGDGVRREVRGWTSTRFYSVRGSPVRWAWQHPVNVLQVPTGKARPFRQFIGEFEAWCCLTSALQGPGPVQGMATLAPAPSRQPSYLLVRPVCSALAWAAVIGNAVVGGSASVPCYASA